MFFLTNSRGDPFVKLWECQLETRKEEMRQQYVLTHTLYLAGVGVRLPGVDPIDWGVSWNEEWAEFCAVREQHVFTVTQSMTEPFRGSHTG